MVLSWVWTASNRMVQTTEGISGALRKKRMLAEAKDMFQLYALELPGLTATCNTKSTGKHCLHGQSNRETSSTDVIQAESALVTIV